MKTLIILRGIPGSGKTTYAQSLLLDMDRDERAWTSLISAERHRNISGRYVHRNTDNERVSVATMDDVLTAARAGAETIIVDDTNTRFYEYRPYVLVGKALGYGIKIIRFDCPIALATARDIHDTPPRKMAEMFHRVNEPTYYPDNEVINCVATEYKPT